MCGAILPLAHTSSCNALTKPISHFLLHLYLQTRACISLFVTNHGRTRAEPTHEILYEIQCISYTLDNIQLCLGGKLTLFSLTLTVT